MHAIHCAFHENRIGGRIKFCALSKISEGEILLIFLILLTSREGRRWTRCLFPDLKIGATLAVFKVLGKKSSSKQNRKYTDRKGAKTSAPSLIKKKERYLLSH